MSKQAEKFDWSAKVAELRAKIDAHEATLPNLRSAVEAAKLAAVESQNVDGLQAAHAALADAESYGARLRDLLAGALAGQAKQQAEREEGERATRNKALKKRGETLREDALRVEAAAAELQKAVNALAEGAQDLWKLSDAARRMPVSDWRSHRLHSERVHLTLANYLTHSVPIIPKPEYGAGVQLAEYFTGLHLEFIE